jgi:hypothetical protein
MAKGANKCYIAGKIGGLEVADYTERFEVAKAEVLLMGFKPVSPIELPHNHGKTWEEYMREDIKELMDCQCLYALTNWRHSVGATIEVNTAVSVGIDIIHQVNKNIEI